MATLNIGIKYSGQVNSRGVSSVSFTVPSGSYFRGVVSGEITSNDLRILHPFVRVRQTAGAVIIASSGSNNSQAYGAASDNDSHIFTPQMFIELGAGSYSVEVGAVGQAAFTVTNAAVAGVLLSNTQ